MKNLSHKNIVKFYGLTSTKDENITLVLEFMSGNSLLRRLKQQKKNGLVMEISERIWYIYQISCGMSHLVQNRIVHCDLAARNCLLSDSHEGFNGYPVLKISDFGLAKVLTEENDSIVKKDNFLVREKIPLQWMAPESILYKKFSEKSDVWAFGVTMWEIFSDGEVPYDSIDFEDIVMKIKEGYQLIKPSGCSQTIYPIMRDCWYLEDKKRMSFRNLENAFRNIFVSYHPSYRNVLLSETRDGYVDVDRIDFLLESSLTKNIDDVVNEIYVNVVPKKVADPSQNEL